MPERTPAPASPAVRQVNRRSVRAAALGLADVAIVCGVAVLLRASARSSKGGGHDPLA